MDRPDVQVAVRCLSRVMGCPTKQKMLCLKRLVLYLHGTRHYNWYLKPSTAGLNLFGEIESTGHRIELHTDADWGGAKSDRRSSSAAALYVDNNCIFHIESQPEMCEFVEL